VRSEKLVAEAVRKLIGRGTSTFGSRYQETASEDSECFMCAIVNSDL
jgi:hypothetical protein